MAAQDQDSRNLHDLAVDTQTDLQKLATGLAHAGAAPQAVSQLTKFADVIGGVVKALGEGPSLDAAAQQGQPPQAGPPQPQAPVPQQQTGPPQPQAQVQNHTLHSATHALHAAMIASKQRQQ